MSERAAVAVFGSSATELGTSEWIEAERTGGLLAGAGLAVLTGGYGGTMEAVSKGAAMAGGHVIGVTAGLLFRERSSANPYVIQEIVAETLTERIGHLVGLAQGSIVLPGSIGTAAELVIAWNINHIVRLSGGVRFPTVAVGETWRDLADLLANGAGAYPNDVHLADDAQQAVEWLLEQPEIGAVDPPTL